MVKKPEHKKVGNTVTNSIKALKMVHIKKVFFKKKVVLQSTVGQDLGAGFLTAQKATKSLLLEVGGMQWHMSPEAFICS